MANELNDGIIKSQKEILEAHKSTSDSKESMNIYSKQVEKSNLD